MVSIFHSLTMADLERGCIEAAAFLKMHGLDAPTDKEMDHKSC